jgi:hypothetical protein
MGCTRKPWLQKGHIEYSEQLLRLLLHVLWHLQPGQPIHPLLLQSSAADAEHRSMTSITGRKYMI